MKINDNISKKNILGTMLNTTLLYSFMCNKACTHPSKWTRKYCHTITSRVDDVYTSYTPRNHSIQDYPHFPKKFIQNIQIWQPNSPYIHIYIYIWLRKCYEPQVFYGNPQTKKCWDIGHQQELPQAKVVFNLLIPSDYEKCW